MTQYATDVEEDDVVGETRVAHIIEAGAVSRKQGSAAITASGLAPNDRLRLLLPRFLELFDTVLLKFCSYMLNENVGIDEVTATINAAALYQAGQFNVNRLFRLGGFRPRVCQVRSDLFDGPSVRFRLPRLLPPL
jgi:hypothetical protein